MFLHSCKICSSQREPTMIWWLLRPSISDDFFAMSDALRSWSVKSSALGGLFTLVPVQLSMQLVSRDLSFNPFPLNMNDISGGSLGSGLLSGLSNDFGFSFVMNELRGLPPFGGDLGNTIFGMFGS